MRMVEHAVRLAKTGRVVYVVMHNRAQCMAWEQEVATRMRGADLNIRFETASSLGDDLDWYGMQLRGAYPNCVLLVDHAVIEAKFRNTFRMYQQYDTYRNQRFERLVKGIPARERYIDTHPDEL